MKKFDYELEKMRSRLIEMGELTRSMVRLVAAGLKDRTLNIYEQVAAKERQLDQMQMAIDHEAVRMLTVYGPVATDLRYLLVCTHVTSQLERIGDQTLNICESLQMMHGDPAEHPILPNIVKMADLTCELLDDALDAYFTKSADKAIVTRTRDDVIDALNDQANRELLTIEVLQDVLSGAKDIADAVAQILIARYVERIADQATNICKEVVYMVRGDDVRHTRHVQ